MKRCLTALLLVAAGATHAGPTPPPIRAEIDGLLAEMAQQPCRFERNGRWHSQAEARELLLHKLGQIEASTTLRSTEQFIELAATRSSTSGKPYAVQCGQQPSTPSGDWLRAALARLRQR